MPSDRLNPPGLEFLPDGSLVVPSQSDARHSRLWPGTGGKSIGSSDLRTETERDRARLGYSAYLRRLAGVTQVVSPDLTSARLHTRASHTHKVALVSRELAEHLTRKAVSGDAQTLDAIRRSGGLDITACEAAGLAHDLGHPPFGHAGEEELDRLLLSRGQPEGFEGNAQSFRIVSTLDTYKTGQQGLNLTTVTRGAILKYPWARNISGEGTSTPGFNMRHQKFSAYDSDLEELRLVRDALFAENDERAYPGNGKRPMQSLEASVMDLADDIAYSVHDLEDFLTAGVIDVSDAIVELDVAARHYTVKRTEAVNVFIQAEKKLRTYESDLFNETRYGEALTVISKLLSVYGEAAPATKQADLELHLRKLLSKKVNEFFDAIEVGEFVESGRRVRLKSSAWHEMQVMKYVTKRQLVSTPRMGAIQRSQTLVTTNLFTGLEQWLLSVDERSSMPEPFLEFLENLDAAVPIAWVPANEESEPKQVNRLAKRPASRESLEWSAGTDIVIVRTLTPAHYRAITDYICGMSDSEALLRSQWLTGSEVPGMSSLGVLH